VCNEQTRLLCGSIMWVYLSSGYIRVKNEILVMTEGQMIQYLQARFGLSLIQANVIYFKLEEHFKKL